MNPDMEVESKLKTKAILFALMFGMSSEVMAQTSTFVHACAMKQIAPDVYTCAPEVEAESLKGLVEQAVENTAPAPIEPGMEQTFAPEFSWDLSVTFGVGRTYDIPVGMWRVAQVPGVELNLSLSKTGNLSIAFQRQMNSDFTNSLQSDVYLSYEKRLTERISASLNWSQSNYHAEDYDTDRLWYVEGKYKLFGK